MTKVLLGVYTILMLTAVLVAGTVDRVGRAAYIAYGGSFDSRSASGCGNVSSQAVFSP